MSKNIFTFNKEKNDKTNSIFMENIENKYKEKTNQLIKSLVLTIPFTVSILNSQMFNEINDLNLLRYQLNIQDITKNSSNDLQKVFQVNNYVNSYKYKSDIDNYGEKEYYASPLEMIKKQAGDCEDYAILKYNILVKEFELDKNNFKFVFGKSKEWTTLIPDVFKSDLRSLLSGGTIFIGCDGDCNPRRTEILKDSLINIDRRPSRSEMNIDDGIRNPFQELKVKHIRDIQGKIVDNENSFNGLTDCDNEEIERKDRKSVV